MKICSLLEAQLKISTGSPQNATSKDVGFDLLQAETQQIREDLDEKLEQKFHII